MESQMSMTSGVGNLGRCSCLALAKLVLAFFFVAGLGGQQFALSQETTETAALPEADSELLATEELEALVAPVAFYPDEVLAVVLPAATYPLEIVQGARLLAKKQSDPNLQPNQEWDPSVLALLNYPSVITMMNDDLDWTTQLGEAVLAQQGDVIDAIQQVRKSAYTTGYLKSDDKTTVVYEQDVIQIQPADPQVVYVPVYEPAPAPATTTTVVYSEPYTPYYVETAAFWTGALVGGVAMGFLMDWDDDDIDIDINDGDWDDWHPGRGGDTDIDIDRGDINIGGDVNIGNDVRVGKGDSWRKARDQRVKAGALPASATRKKGVQPVAGLETQKKKRTSATAATGAGASATQQAATKKKKKTTQTAASAQQSAGAFGGLQNGQSTAKSKKRGQQSQEATGQTTAKKKQRQFGTQAFDGVSNGEKTKQFSNRGSSSQKKKKKRK